MKQSKHKGLQLYSFESETFFEQHGQRLFLVTTFDQFWHYYRYDIIFSAGTSPTFWTRGLACLGLAGTRGLASPTEELLSFKTSPSLLRSDD